MKTKKLIALLLSLVMVVGLLPTMAMPVFATDNTYECADVTQETDTGKTIGDVPVYLISLAKGYDGLLFKDCNKNKRVRIVSGSASVVADLATNNEITRDQ